MICTDTNINQVLEETSDPNLSEQGDVPLGIGQAIVQVTFVTVKVSSDYRFEYLYVDAFGQINPGTVLPVVISQTAFGFNVDLGGVPDVPGYVLRWRVVVVGLTSALVPVNIDAPESIRFRLTANALSALIPFTNFRSTTEYGFSELRVENLDDPFDLQSPILAQVCVKNLGSFRVALSPRPPNNNYFLVARTP